MDGQSIHLSNIDPQPHICIWKVGCHRGAMNKWASNGKIRFDHHNGKISHTIKFNTRQKLSMDTPECPFSIFRLQIFRSGWLGGQNLGEIKWSK
uniref:Uncharacterized protein n=1 Tax=Lepeophtheirus salmonis TaxID=72036 RepID=A0A0K2UWU5_LEPSM